MPKIAIAATSRTPDSGTGGRFLPTSAAGTDGARRLQGPVALYALVVALLAGLFAAAPATPAAAGEPETIYSLVNEARANNGLGALNRNSGLDAVAAAWAKQMSAQGNLVHNPNVGDQIPSGWSSWGENIAQGHRNGAAMHEGWMNSPGHYANIMGDFTAIGIAFYNDGSTTWGVEVFATYPGGGGGGSANVSVPAKPAPEPTADDQAAADEKAAADAAAAEKAAAEKAVEKKAAEKKAAVKKKKAAQKKAAEKKRAARMKAAQKRLDQLAVRRAAATEQRVDSAGATAAPASASKTSALAAPEATAATRELRTANPVLLGTLGAVLLLALLLLSPTIRRRILPSRNPRHR
jgi:uncharacterized protein YkwD